jgi:hypothetical protein
MMEGVNSTMIYFKNFCKCHNVPSPSTTIIKIKNKIKKRKSALVSQSFLSSRTGLLQNLTECAIFGVFHGLL